ncbi:hypothetical protein [Bdellovibrio bacteriovorus]|uniref:hypothetical protein n=1 Tax=Bdellovibrio bacteriovorus TaxID=959 RepID=UPI0035A9A13A
MHKALVLILTFISSLALAKEKVAVIFVGNADPILQEREAAALKFYETYGYRVIRLSPNSDKAATSESFKKTLAGLKNVESLHVEFLGHGELKENGKKYYMMAADKNGEGLDIKRSLEVQDLKKSLQDFQKKNPEAESTVYALNCFGGRIPQALADLPRTQAFSATRGDVKSWTFLEGGESRKNVDFLVFFQRGLEEGKTFQEAFADATKEYQKIQKQNPSRFPFAGEPAFSLPRSQSQEYVLKWCSSKTTGSSVPDDSQKRIARKLKSQHAETTEYIQSMKSAVACSKTSEIKQEAESLKTIEKNLKEKAVKKLQEVILSSKMDETLPKFIDDLQGAMDFYREMDNDPSVAEKMEEVRNDLRELFEVKDEVDFARFKEAKAEKIAEEIKACDGNKPPEFCDSGKALYMLFTYGQWSTEDLKPEEIVQKCARPTPALVSAEKTLEESQKRQQCFVKESENNPLAAYMAFSTNSKSLQSFCSTFKPAEDFYKKEGECLERFGKQASAKDWKRLQEIDKMSQGRMSDTSSKPKEREQGGVR